MSMTSYGHESRLYRLELMSEDFSPNGPFGFKAFARQFHDLSACNRARMRADATPRPSKALRRVTAGRIPWRR